MGEHPGFRGTEGAHTAETEAGEGPQLADLFAPESSAAGSQAQAGGEAQGRDEAKRDKRALMAQVEEVLEELRPYIQMDGGDIELVDVTDDGVVQVRMHGACVGCSASIYTLQLGVEQRLKESIPEIRYVEAV